MITDDVSVQDLNYASFYFAVLLITTYLFSRIKVSLYFINILKPHSCEIY